MEKSFDYILPALTGYEVSFRGTTFTVIDGSVSRTPIWLMRDFQDLPDFSNLGIKTMLDIGANTGMFSFYMQRCYPDLEITAIEAVPQNMQHFCAGLVLNGFNKIVPLCAAVVGKGNASAPFFFNPTQSGCGKLVYDMGDQQVQVNRIYLDEVFNKPFDFVKCDIEGAEFDVLETFTKWDMVGSLFIELHPYPRETEPEKQKKLYEDFSAYIREKMQGKPVWIPHPGGF